jgi:hypothetical protein
MDGAKVFTDMPTDSPTGYSSLNPAPVAAHGGIGLNGSCSEDAIERSTPLPVSYAQRFAAAQWSAAQIEQQLVWVEELLDDESASPAAVAALRQARASLRHGSHCAPIDYYETPSISAPFPVRLKRRRFT